MVAGEVAAVAAGVAVSGKLGGETGDADIKPSHAGFPTSICQASRKEACRICPMSWEAGCRAGAMDWAGCSMWRDRRSIQSTSTSEP